jgi:hypothetical protein
MFASRYRATLTAKMIGIIVRSRGGVGAMTFSFLHPRATKLRATIATGKITSIIKINFHITGYDIIFVSCGCCDSVKIYGSPRFTGSVVSVRHFAQVLHVPAVLAFGWPFASQHHLALLFFPRRVVKSPGISTYGFNWDLVQGRMIATVVHSCGKMEAYLFPFG